MYDAREYRTYVLVLRNLDLVGHACPNRGYLWSPFAPGWMELLCAKIRNLLGMEARSAFLRREFVPLG